MMKPQRMSWVVVQTAADLGTARVMTADGLLEICRCSPTNAPVIAAARDLQAVIEAIPLLVRLGNFIGNGDVDPSRPGSLGLRCDTIYDARTLLAKIKEGNRCQ